MVDIVNLSIFNECELILIDANSPGNEKYVIDDYLSVYSNIRYLRLEKDPGLYAVWNLAIRMAEGDLITNANLDDRHNPSFLEQEVKLLEDYPEIDLVYADFYVVDQPNLVFEICGPYTTLTNKPEFSRSSLKECIQGPHPVWRKSLHDRWGYFDESFHASGDWEMWCRAASSGAIFKKMPGISGVYYINPEGLSTDKKSRIHKYENFLIRSKYHFLWE